MRDHTPEALKRARDLRREMTHPELRLWTILRDREICHWKWRRQHPRGIYILDFFCHEAELVVEIDGNSHAFQAEYDANRTAWLEQQGLRVIRFTNDEVETNLDEVVEEIKRVCGERNPNPGTQPSPHPSLPPEEEGDKLRNVR